MDIIQALAERGIKPHRSGSFRIATDVYTTCPNCSPNRKPQNRKLPCLSVRLDENGGAVWHCNHCDWADNIPGRRRDNGPAREFGAPRKVEHRPARQVPVEASLLPKARQWLAARGISDDVMDELRLYSTAVQFPQDFGVGQREDGTMDWDAVPSTPCIAFPYSLDGKVVNHKYRDAKKRFCQDPKAQRTLFNADRIAEDEVIWVEGEMDVATVMTAGYPSVVSLPDGAPGKLKDESDPAREHDRRFEAMAASAEALEKLKKIVIATDADQPGDNLAEEIGRRLGKQRCWRVRWPDGYKDANEVVIGVPERGLAPLGLEGLKICIEGATPYPMEGIYDVAPGDLLRFRNSPKMRTFSTGFRNVDTLFQIPADGRLFVVTGIPNSGKSEFIDAIVVNTAKTYGWHAIMCSPENMPPETHAAKIAEKFIGASFYGTAHSKRMDDWQVDQAEKFLGQHISFLARKEAKQSMTLDWVLDTASAIVLRRGSRWLVLDPWNRFEHQRGRMQESEYIGYALDKLSQWAALHSCNVVLVAHPAKLREDPKTKKQPVPGGYDVSGSANFFNIPDFGITVHRPDKDSTVVEIHVWKVRFKTAGRKGETKLNWSYNTGQYSDYDDSYNGMNFGRD